VTAAVAQARIGVEDISCIFWHGTGTRKNDETEANVSSSFWRETKRFPISTTTKGSLGHTMGAASAFNVAAACQCLKEGLVPPVAGLRDTEFTDMNLVTQNSMRTELSTALCVGMGFGGVNAALVLQTT
jgi:3-oxoacyl-[acyl-carrier-protein] synthase II